LYCNGTCSLFWSMASSYGCEGYVLEWLGCIFMLVEGVVSWKSFKQTFTSTSTMEVEYITRLHVKQFGWKILLLSLTLWRVSLDLLLYIVITLSWYASLVIITQQNSESILTQNSCLLERRFRSFKLELSILPKSLWSRSLN